MSKFAEHISGWGATAEPSGTDSTNGWASTAKPSAPEPNTGPGATAETSDTTAKSSEPGSTPATAPAPATAAATDVEKTDVEDGQLDGPAMENRSGLEEGEYEVQISLEAMQNDQSADNPLYSLNKKFDDLIQDENLRRAISEMNFKKPSKVQASALPFLLGPQTVNMIAQSQSGTGKTATFVLTILSRADHTQPAQPQGLILAPTRELARQIEDVVKNIGKHIPNLLVHAAVPGNHERGQRIDASVVVGTPGTVMDLINRRQLDVSKLKILCLDEADNMMDQQGFGDQCMRIRNTIPGVAARTTQVLLFSATFPDEVMPFSKQFCPEAVELRLQKSELNVKGISQMYIDCPEGEGKYEVLVKLYGLMNIGSSIIFVKERRHADQIAHRMTEEGHSVVHIHGAFEASERDHILGKFRRGEAKVLITTNVLARGIDVSTVSMVINYDIPMLPDNLTPDGETYIHRIGRTGRFGRVGVSISFVNDRRSFFALKTISEKFHIELVQLSVTDWDETEEVVQRVIKSSRAAPKFGH